MEILDEIVNFLAINAKSNWAVVQANIPWLAERSPVHACRVLANELVPLGPAIGLAKERLKKYYPEILYMILFRQNLGNRASLVAEYCRLICPLLSGVRDQTAINRENFAFCACVIRDPEASVDAIEEELGDHLIRVLREFGRDVQEDIKSIETGMDERWPKSVKVELFRATGKIEEALTLLWGSDDAPDIKACKRFCRGMNEPAAAFAKLIEKINHNSHFLPAQRTEHLTRLLARNMSAIDIPSALANLDANQPLEGEVATFLENSDRKFDALRKEIDLEAAFAESNIADRQNRLVAGPPAPARDEMREGFEL
jgi:hypothetical protein